MNLSSIPFISTKKRSWICTAWSIRKKEVKKVILFGVNDLAEIASISLRGTDIEVVGVADDERAGEEFLGFRVKSIQDLKKAQFDKVIITINETNNCICFNGEIISFHWGIIPITVSFAIII